MRAAYYTRQGPATEVLTVGELPTPEPGDDQVRVRLYASAVNPSDVKKRAGAQPAPIDQGPVVPHSDGAGVIDAVGPGVPATRIGERVWVYQAQYQHRLGTAAEFVVLPAARVAPLPDNTSFEVGACLGIPAMTAHRCVFADGPVANQTLLVTGGAGRVGHYAIQWASQAGARVLATASAANAPQAHAAGAVVVIDYRGENVAAAIQDATDGAGVDRIIDVEFGANLDASLQVLKENGTIATYSSSQAMTPALPFYPLMFRNITIRMVLVYGMPESAKRQALTDIEQALASDALIHRIVKRFPLTAIANAHLAIERGGPAGCVVVNID